MADKQATVYIVDQGQSTREIHNGRTESDLQYGMRYVWEKIALTMAANRVTWGVGVLGLRNDETNIPLDDPEGYENITVLKVLGPIEMSHLSDLKRDITPSSTDAGDALSAIIVAVRMIETFTTLKSGKPGKYTRKIVLVTNGQGVMDDSDLDAAAEKINEFGIELLIIGVDFDDPDFGFKEEDKPAQKRRNEAIFKSLTEKCNNATFATAAEVVQDLSIPKPKISKPYTTYIGKLSLGDFEKYPETALYIDVKRYFRTKAAKPPSASSFVTRSTPTDGESSVQSSNTVQGDTEMQDAPDLSLVKSAVTYKVNDVSAPGGRRDVERDDLAKGYAYGRTAVHISESDENVTKLETLESFTIIGFIPSDKYEPYLNMGESCITVAQSVNDKAKLALSSFIHALYEMESYAVARIVLKDGKDPLIVLLAPSIEPDLEALIDVPLPFAEDVRVYRFPPLDRVITTSGVTVTKHRNLPSDDLEKATSDYVDTMDLSTFGKDDDGQPTEYMKIDETYSPVVHRINQAIRNRAVYPTEPVDPPPDILMKWSNPPPELVKSSASKLEKLVEAASVKRVPPKKKGSRFKRDPIKPLSGLDVDSLLDRGRAQKISKENSIPDLKQILANTTSDSSIHDAAKQMSRIICDLVKDATGETGYDRAAENIKVLREELISLETPEIYNDFIRDLKHKILTGNLDGDRGGNRREFFLQLRNLGLGLIDHQTVEQSEVSAEEAAAFYSLKTDLPTWSK
ncbi:hypothetical protein G7Y89_g8662 [Cudoniella acicularis]|uniref:ATP-dependent DNA helicase II subunit 2 n=1 Tax=Cudoniella acicularis TaxID=354080 RepID=A0A8H4RJV1_9HELO|nr:hypothetical protein G7Y89_g8662 [Cudoniella acicularis]